MWRRMQRWIHRLPEWVKLSVMGIIALGFFVFGATITWAAFMPIPAINNFENRQVAESTKIYDRTGNIVLYDVHGAMRRTAIPLEDISPYIRQATVAIEDATFYEHHGFRPLSFMRAVWTNIMYGELLSGQGGSTITQQVVKNALLTQDKTVTRKIKEIILAVRLDRLYSKDQILNVYLNENPYGGTVYGIQEASQYFFGVDAMDVTLAQAAYLAALPQAPTRYSPYGNNRNLLESRKNRVLQQMFENGYIDEEQLAAAKSEEVVFRDQAEAGIKAPHFVFYVRQYLEDKYGVDAVLNDGLRVITTLDYDMQKKAEEIVAEYAPGMERNFNATNEGMVAIDPTSGHILTMVGSRGYFDETIDGKVNVAISHRQPGSSFKPFVYATAFQKGYTPETVVFDLQTQFSTACAVTDYANSNPPCYSPGNYDGLFKGPMTLRNALAQSQNIPAVKTLYLAGIQDSIETARRMGITTLVDAARYGLTLVLGGGEVTLLDMTSAYSVFANDGIRNPSTPILRVEDKKGKILEEYQPKSERVLDSEIARKISDVLSDNVARTPEFGADSPLNFPGYDVADKTGTTNDFRDVWIVGYTPGISIGAWAGNNDNSPMERRIAAFIIAPMWHDFMEYALEKYPSDGFPAPAPDPELDSLPPVLRGEWNTNPAEGIHEILYWVNKDNPRSGRPTNPWSDSQFAYWEFPVSLWAAGQNMGGSSTTTPSGEVTGDKFRVLSPAAGGFAQAGQPMSISSYYPYPQNLIRISYFVNDVPVGSADQAPYAITYVPAIAGPSSLRAMAQTHQGIETYIVPFTVQ